MLKHGLCYNIIQTVTEEVHIYFIREKKESIWKKFFCLCFVAKIICSRQQSKLALFMSSTLQFINTLNGGYKYCTVDLA